MTIAPPTADEQLTFLNHLQRLLEEGDFTATYKYALLLALAELAVERGDDSGAALILPLRAIAEKFAALYWPQTAPYAPMSDAMDGGVLYQNLGQQAAVVSRLQTLRSKATTLSQARRHPNWDSTLGAIARVVREMPVRYLQNLGGATLPFLYEPHVTNGALQLLPGAAFHLRRFHGFIQHLTRAKWVEHVRTNSRNQPIVGPAADLEGFMFGASRAQLSGVSTALRSIQNNHCFFCRERLGAAVAVDHFIPWSRYPRDTALNFVLAHASCNADKRELLAGARHLERWMDRNQVQGNLISEALEPIGFIGTEAGTAQIAQWAYTQACNIGAQVWISRRHTDTISLDVLKVFS